MQFPVRGGVSAQLYTQDYSMDLVLRAMLEEFDKGYELLRMIEEKELQLTSSTLESLLECVNVCHLIYSSAINS